MSKVSHWQGLGIAKLIHLQIIKSVQLIPTNDPANKSLPSLYFLYLFVLPFHYEISFSMLSPSIVLFLVLLNIYILNNLIFLLNFKYN